MLVVLLTVGLTTLGLGTPLVAQADTTPEAGVPATVSADGLPTWQVNGVVWSQVVVGTTVYVTGKFTRARPPGVAVGGAGEVAAANIFAFNITTGNRVSTFSHQLNAQGLAIAASPDGSKVFVGGDFTTVDGTTRSHIAAFNTATGALVTTFAPSIGGQVRALAATATTVYAGGAYNSVGGSARGRLSAHDTTSGALRTWAPTVDRTVWAMTLTPDSSRVIVGGMFTTLNGVSTTGMGSIDATSGVAQPWAANQTLRASGDVGAITTLRTDGTQIYGGAYAYGGAGNNFEGTFAADPMTGAVNWANDCHGDTYDVLPVGQVLYSAGHAHDCTWIGSFPDTNPRVKWQRALANTTYPTGTNTGPDSYGWDHAGTPAASVLQWFPDLTAGSFTGQAQGPWSLAGNASYTVMGGEFPRVNGVAQQGLVRFATKALATNKRGPSYTTVPATPVPPTTAASLSAGTARVAFGTAWDQDNESLTYVLIRDGVVLPSTTKQLKSNFWLLPSDGFVDTGLVPGSTHTYQIRITDSSGNVRYSPTSNQVTITSKTLSAYAKGVIADGASSFWRLGEPSGTSVFDYAGYADATTESGVTRGAAGAIDGDADTASTFNGSPSGTAATNVAQSPATSFSLESWVKTTSNSGGKIIGFGAAKTGNSNNYDRHVYMDNSGRITFGVYPGGVRAVRSADAYNDGTWHHVVASLDAASGMSLYVDGTRVGNDPATTSGQDYTGYWRIGGDNLNGWPNKPSSNNLIGDIDDVAIYPAALSATKVEQHYVAGGDAAVNPAPTAKFTSSVAGLVASVDGSTSTDDGSIASYSWDFGDNTAADSGVSPSHTYAVAGTYPVKLTVTDNQGATGTVTHDVTVAASPANEAPVAAFTSTTTNLSASFDGTGSDDADGTVDSYSWDYGDSTPAGTTVSPSHTYAVAGTYQVELTVTDNQGATGTVTHPVTVTAPAGVTPVVADTFGRTVANGWGSADTGGIWTVNASTQKKVAGGVGSMTVAAGSSGSSYLNATTTTDADLTVTASADKVANGNGAYLYVFGRRVSGAGDYRLQARLRADGTVGASLLRVTSAGAQTVIRAETTVPGIELVAGAQIKVHLQVTGTSPTTVRAKVWAGAGTEPATWLVSGTDSTSGFQDAGSVGLGTYLSASANNGPVTTSFDDLDVRPTTP